MSEENNDIARREKPNCSKNVTVCRNITDSYKEFERCMAARGCPLASVQGGEEVASANPPMCTPPSEKQTGRER